MAVPTPATSTDAQLLLAAHRGDRGALKQLMARWWPSILRWCVTHLQDRVLAEDAAQDVVIRVIRHHRSCDAHRPFGPWLYRLVKNCSHDVRARQNRFRRRETSGPEPFEPARIERALDISRAGRRALKAFEVLPSRQREVLDLVDIQGLRAVEAAVLMDIAPGTARATLHQARRALREQMLDTHGDIVALLRET